MAPDAKLLLERLGRNLAEASTDEIARLIRALPDRQDELERENAALRAAREELTDGSAFQALLLESVPAPVLVKDVAGHYLDCNTAFADLMGLPRSAIIGRTVHDIAPGDAASVYEAQDHELLNGIARRHAYDGVITDARGEAHDVIFYKSRVAGADGELRGLITVIIDISDRKRAENQLRISEQRHRLLADNANDVVWEMALDGAITYVSPSVERVRGFTVEEAMRQPLDEILTPASQASVIDYFGKLHGAIAEGRTPEPYRGEQEYLCKDGSTFWTEVMAYPVQGADGTVVGLLGVTRDLSERKRYEAELLDANEALRRHRDHLDELVLERTRELAAARDAAESANRAKTSLLANVSHELRTPLNHIGGYAHLLGTRLTDAKQKIQAERIADASRHLLKLVENLLDTANLEAQELSLEVADFDLRSLVDRSVAAVRGLADAKGIALASEVDPALPESLVGDAIRLGQVLHNLLDNALKFSERGQVGVRVRRIDAPGGRVGVRFEVEDQGIGVDAAQRDRLFTLFDQGDGSTTRKQGGTGLGLALCLRLVSLMAGEIGVEHPPHGGSRFWFTVTLPPGEASRASVRDGVEH